MFTTLMPTDIAFPKSVIEKTVKEMGNAISQKYKGNSLLMLCVIEDSYTFLTDLLQSISVPVTVGFISIDDLLSGPLSKTIEMHFKEKCEHLVIVKTLFDPVLHLGLKSLSYLEFPRVNVDEVSLLISDSLVDQNFSLNYNGLVFSHEKLLAGYGITNKGIPKKYYPFTFRNLRDIYYLEKGV